MEGKAFPREPGAWAADRRPEEPALALEQYEKLAQLNTRADSLNNARTVLEDAPAEVLGRFDRWLLVDAVACASDAASAEAQRYREELGLRD